MLDYRRRIIQAVWLETWNGRFANLFYRTTQGVGVKTRNGNIANYVKRVENIANGNDNKHITMFAFRLLTATIKTTETIFNKTVFLRVLAECSKIHCQVILGWIYIRKLMEHIQAHTSIRRRLSVVVKIISKILPHGSPLGRLFKLRSEIVLKSKIVVEIILDSKIK